MPPTVSTPKRHPHLLTKRITPERVTTSAASPGFLGGFQDDFRHGRPHRHSALAYRPSAPEAQLPRSQALDFIPWSGLQRVSGLTYWVAPLAGVGQCLLTKPTSLEVLCSYC